MLVAYLLFAAQAVEVASPPLPLPDYAHVETWAQARARTVAFRDGYVTQDELARYTAVLLKGTPVPDPDAAHPLPPQSLALFAAADTDQDGRISLAEAVAAAHRDFDLQDTNHDGVVTPAERMAFVMRIAKTRKTPEGVSIIPTADRASPFQRPT